MDKSQANCCRRLKILKPSASPGTCETECQAQKSGSLLHALQSPTMQRAFGRIIPKPIVANDFQVIRLAGINKAECQAQESGSLSNALQSSTARKTFGKTSCANNSKSSDLPVSTERIAKLNSQARHQTRPPTVWKASSWIIKLVAADDITSSASPHLQKRMQWGLG